MSQPFSPAVTVRLLAFCLSNSALLLLWSGPARAQTAAKPTESAAPVPLDARAADQPATAAGRNRPFPARHAERRESGTESRRCEGSVPHDQGIGWHVERRRAQAGSAVLQLHLQGGWHRCSRPAQRDAQDQFLQRAEYFPRARPTAHAVGAANVPHGVVHHHYYRSNIVGINSEYYVYTPPGFDPGSKQKYPVLYLLHGYSDDPSAWTQWEKPT